MLPRKHSVISNSYEVIELANQDKSMQYKLSQQKSSQSKEYFFANDMKQITQKQLYLSEQKQHNQSRKYWEQEFQQQQKKKRKRNEFDDKKIKRIEKIRYINNNKKSHRQGSIASKLNKNFVQIIQQQLKTLNIQIDFTKDYVTRYNLHGQKQNILILPFLVMDCLVENSQSFFCENQGSQNLSHYIAQKSEKFLIINKTFQTIFNRLEFFLQKQSNQKNKISKVQKDHESHSIATKHPVQVCFQIINYLKFHLYSIFISGFAQIISLNQLKYTIESREGSHNYPLSSLSLYKSQNLSILQSSNLPLNRFQAQAIIQEGQQSKAQDQLNQLFQKLFKVKQRDIDRAKDKFRSIQLSTKLLRFMFRIQWDYKMPIKQFLERSIDEEQKREYGLTKKNNHWYKDKFYNLMLIKRAKYITEVKKEQNEENLIQNQNITNLAEDILMALMCISLLRRKNAQILKEFIELINRRIEYMDQKQESTFMYGKRTYQYFVSLLSRPIENKSTKRPSLRYEQEKNKSITSEFDREVQLSTQYSIQEWNNYQGQKEEECREKKEEGLSVELSSLIRVIVNGYEQIRKEFREQDLTRQGLTLMFNFQTGVNQN